MERKVSSASIVTTKRNRFLAVGFVASEKYSHNWLNAYSKTNPQLLFAYTGTAKRAASPGNCICFENGELFQITGQEKSGSNLIVILNADRPLNFYKYGDLLNAEIYDSDRKSVGKEEISSDKSQFGLQGKVFLHAARHIPEEMTLELLNLFCSLMTAFVFSSIIFLIRKKYNSLMAGCFFTTVTMDCEFCQKPVLG